MTRCAQVVIIVLLSACLRQLAAASYPERYKPSEFSRNYLFQHNKDLQKSSGLKGSEISMSDMETGQDESIIQDLIAVADALSKRKEKNPTCLTIEDVEIMSSVLQLDMNTLRRLIATINSEAVGLPQTTSTIILAEYGRIVSENADSTVAMYDFFGRFSSSTYPKDIWINRAPCPTCVHSIMNNYNSGTGVTIYIAEFEQGANILGTIESLKCLSKLFHKNFIIRPWDWELFRDTFNLKAECRSIIDQVVFTDKIMDKQQEVSSVLKYIEDTSKVPDSTIMEWCNIPNMANWKE